MMKHFKSRRGQVTMEMMVLWGVVVIALIWMTGFFGRHVKGNVMNQAKSVSEEPWGTSANYTANNTSNSTTNSNAASSTTNSNSTSNTALNVGALQ